MREALPAPGAGLLAPGCELRAGAPFQSSAGRLALAAPAEEERGSGVPGTVAQVQPPGRDAECSAPVLAGMAQTGPPGHRGYQG